MLEELYSVPEKIIEVHSIGFHELVLVALVYFVDDLFLRESASGRKIFFRALFALLALADHRYDKRSRSEFVVYSEVFADTPDECLFICLIVYRKAGLVTEPLR